MEGTSPAMARCLDASSDSPASSDNASIHSQASLGGIIEYEALLSAACGDLLGPLAPRLPAPPFLGIDQIWDLETTGGVSGLGGVKGRLDLKRFAWVFECHFVDDPVLPGTLVLDAMLQLVGFCA